jgi:hypothetical protein
MFAWIRTKTTKKWYRKPKKNGSYPLVNIQKAIENGHRNSEFFPIKNGGSSHSYVNVYQRVCS